MYLDKKSVLLYCVSAHGPPGERKGHSSISPTIRISLSFNGRSGWKALEVSSLVLNHDFQRFVPLATFDQNEVDAAGDPIALFIAAIPGSCPILFIDGQFANEGPGNRKDLNVGIERNGGKEYPVWMEVGLEWVRVSSNVLK